MITRKPYNRRYTGPTPPPAKPPDTEGVTLVPCYQCLGRGRDDDGLCHTCWGRGRILWNPEWVNPMGPNPSAG